MIVEIATDEIIPDWLELAREVEPMFQVSMADDDSFREFMKKKMVQKEAFIVRDESRKKLLGLIAVSLQNNNISWLAVFHQHRRSGVGAILLEYALQKLDAGKEISVTTFHESEEEGMPARQLYRKFGFVEYDPDYHWRDILRSLFKKYPAS
jgi:ribosomal protein S18 acetylase RimI-like enzyme